MALRYDFARLGRARRVASGGVKVSANLTRTGVFEYQQPDGSIRRELRLPEEVFAADSLATLHDAVLTNLHPGQVTPENYKAVAIGHVSAGSIQPQGKFVSGDVVVLDSGSIAQVESGERAELSCGYTCQLENTSGSYQGEKYDAIQRTIRYNHVALGPRDWGRAGPEVSLHLDAADAINLQVIENSYTGAIMKRTFRGKEYDFGSPDHVAALEGAVESETTRADAVTGERDAARTELISTREALTVAQDPKRLDSAVADRVALQARAGKFLGAEFKFDGVASREVMIAAIMKTDSAFKADGRSDDYVRGRFESLALPASNASAIADAITAATRSDGPVQSSDDGYQTVDQIRADAQRQQLEAGLKPLRAK